VLFWLLALGLFLVLVAAHEIGYRVGRRATRVGDQTRHAHAQTWETEVLGLLALLVGFSFAMAVDRFDARRQLIVDEANAIGTTWLRTRFLPEPAAQQLRDQLRAYVDVRLEYYDSGAERARVIATAKRSAELQAQIWSLVVAGASADTRATTTALLVESTNEMIDLEAKRRAALFNHVPWTVLLMIALVASTAVALIGFGRGLVGPRLPFGSIAMPLLIAAVITLIFDIDYPRVGLAHLGQQSMLQLKASL
jgi:prepilin signal peptidase PulO-like enzyme (type II secretory pathway)